MKFQTIKFIEKKFHLESNSAEEDDGTTNEEILKVLIDRLEYQNTVKPDKYTKSCLRSVEQALGFLKWRTNNKRNKKLEYLKKHADRGEVEEF